MEQLLNVLIIAIVALPATACAAIALPSWFGVRLTEGYIGRIVGTAFLLATLAGATAMVPMFASGKAVHIVDLGNWFTVDHYSFHGTLLADHLSLPFAIFVAALTGLIAAFSRRYLHREEGFSRFYLLLALFGAATELVVLAGSLDMVFLGWELVGLASALLIAYFNERQAPVDHGLRAFITYRLCDVGMLGALVWLHHEAGNCEFAVGDAPWPALSPSNNATAAAGIGALLLWASMGKSAQVPLGGWLPRAMEGPTPSSAIFYGSISIHLGPFLLLRASPLLMQTPAVAWAIIFVGGATALHGSFVGRVQTDIKGLLAYASMTQVGLILVEIGCGLHYIPLIHICGHATIRSLEILRSPSLLRDHYNLELAVGRHVPRTPIHIERLLPRAIRPWLYRHALERGYFDALLTDQVVYRFKALMQHIDRLDQRITKMLVGSPPTPPASPDQKGSAK
ncbi:MAG: NADH:ubiquinone oxidoreductase subunit 5 (subunit L)/multisubunit Na+/H+ antiporter MnhA subunit [Planctomycetota bacterium]|jgi:NADH:ubiquinone oxidoreductase subunit 5 (subunit L)/multisubunit Na+/H+ antiporter MnhA subunit